MERISQILKKRLTSHDFALKYIFKESILVLFFFYPLEDILLRFFHRFQFRILCLFSLSERLSLIMSLVLLSITSRHMKRLAQLIRKSKRSKN